jgi:hypothetical protein
MITKAVFDEAFATLPGCVLTVYDNNDGRACFSIVAQGHETRVLLYYNTKSKLWHASSRLRKISVDSGEHKHAQEAIYEYASKIRQAAIYMLEEIDHGFMK